MVYNRIAKKNNYNCNFSPQLWPGDTELIVFQLQLQNWTSDLCRLLDASADIFTRRSTSTPSTFDVTCT